MRCGNHNRANRELTENKYIGFLYAVYHIIHNIVLANRR